MAVETPPKKKRKDQALGAEAQGKRKEVITGYETVKPEGTIWMRCGPRLSSWAIVQVPWGRRQFYLGRGISSGCTDKKLVVTDEQKGPNTKEPGAAGSKFRPVLVGKPPLSSALTLMGVEGTGPGCQPQRCPESTCSLANYPSFSGLSSSSL